MDGKEQHVKKRWISARYILAFAACLGFMNVYGLRVNLSLALVAMINNTATHQHLPHNRTSPEECPFNKINNSTAITRRSASMSATYAWDEYQQGIILGSFFWGYMLTQIAGGRLAEKFGSTRVFGLGVFITAILTLLTPIAARQGFWFLAVLRTLEGLAEGVAYPAVTYLVSLWCPPWERSTMLTIILSGALLGTAIGMELTGITIENWGWPGAFYVCGMIGIAWFIFWILVAYDSPDKHPWISEQEKNYIQSHMENDSKSMVPSNVPWESIGRSLPMWAILVTSISYNWIFYTFITDLPNYLANVLHYNIHENTFRSALPFLGTWMFSILCSLLCDTLIKRQLISITKARKLFNSIGCFLPALLLLIMTEVGCNQRLVYLLLVLSVTTGGAVYAGFMCSPIDIAPNYSGTLKGITNTFGSIPGFMGPYVVGYFTERQSTSHQWRKVFYLISGVNIFAGIFYLIFSNGEIQPWSKMNDPNIIPNAKNIQQQQNSNSKLK